MGIKERYNLKQIYEKPLISEASMKTRIEGIHCLKISSPLYIQYEITKDCNYRCVFCYNVWKNKKKDSIKERELTLKQQLKIIDKLAEMNVFGLILSGGEPLVSKNLFKIIEKASKRYKIEVSIITNGALLTEEVCKKLKECGLSDMQISFHSFKEKDNDDITGTRNSFRRTTLGIRNALKYFSPEKININMVPIKKTYDDVYSTAKFLKNLGVINFTVSSYVYTGNKKLDEEIAPNKKEFQEIYDQIVKVKNELLMRTFIGGCYPLCSLNKRIDDEVISLIGNICDAGVTQLVIGPNGDLRPCVAYDHILGNILEDDPLKIWKNSKILTKIRRMENIPSLCEGCKHLIICRGGCRASAYNKYKKFDSIHPLLEND
ncbi:MAG: AdoMet-dependent heme synthase [Candidatus Woesearchaeota archaeon]|nr:AdoMet-dependent heme synthase [Candidatus Woesearchaeota archaeon]